MFELSHAVSHLCDELHTTPRMENDIIIVESDTRPLEIREHPQLGAILQIWLSPPEADPAAAPTKPGPDLLRVNGSRVHRHARLEALAWEPRRRQFFLWCAVDPGRNSLHDFLLAAEELLNEADFWVGHFHRAAA